MSIVAGRNVVLTGVIEDHSRGTAQALLQNLGARCQSSLGPSTELLVIGAKAGPQKLKKAESLGIEIVPWDVAVGNGSATTTAPSAAPRILDAIRIVSPQLAKAADDVPSGSCWIHELKFDGYRCVATVADGEIAMQSRSGLSEYVEQFPKVAAALVALEQDFILDGELVVTDVHGHSSFETAHTAATGTESYMIFDVLQMGDEDTRHLPLHARRALLEGLLPKELAPLFLSPAHDDGEWLLNWVTERALEGIVSKKRSSKYVEGSRTEAWLKVKVRPEQEFVVLGWKPGEGAKGGVAGSVLLGVRKDDQWVSCGRVGTGRDFEYWRQFTKLPEIDECVECDLGNATPADLNGIVWVEPTCVVQVRFQRWTKDHRLWHPSLQRVRTDKNPLEVVRET